MSVDCRRQIVKRALKYARQQQSAKKKTSETLGSVLLCCAISDRHRHCPSVLWHCWLDVGVDKIKDDQTTGFSCSSLTLSFKWQKGHLAHKNPVVVPVSLSFVRAPAHPGCPGSKGRKTVVCSFWSTWNIAEKLPHLFCEISRIRLGFRQQGRRM